MNDSKSSRQYAAASAPDVVARLRHTIEANETARIVLSDSLGALGKSLDMHLGQIDEHLKQLIADIEGRSR
jgi:hypothetical protein